MDEELEGIVQRMIDAGEPEDNIAKVIQAWEPKKAPEVSGQGSPRTSQPYTEPQETSDGQSSLSQPSDLLPQGTTASEIPLVLTEEGQDNYTGELRGFVNVPASLRAFEEMQREKQDVKAELQVQPTDTPEQFAERGNLAWELLQGINNGVNVAVRGLSRLPAFIYDVAALPQNAIARAVGREDLVVSGDYDNPISEFVDPYIEQRQQDIASKYGTSPIEAFQREDYSGGVRLIANQVAESIPYMIAIGATAGSGAASLTLGGGLSADKYADIQESDVSDALKLTNAIVSGYSELALERVGTGSILRQAENILKGSGREAAEQFTRRSFSEVYETALRKFFPITAPIAEGSEEMATQFVENVMDKITGVNPDIDLRYRLWDSFVVGAAAGSAISTPVSIVNKIKNKTAKREAEQIVQENESIANVSQETLTEGQAEVLSDKFKENNERLNDILQEERATESELTTEQEAQLRSDEVRLEDIDILLQNEDLPQTLRDALEQEKGQVEDRVADIAVRQLEEDSTAEQVVEDTPQQVLETTDDTDTDVADMGVQEEIVSTPVVGARDLSGQPTTEASQSVQVDATENPQRAGEVLQGSFDRLTEGMTPEQIDADPELVSMRDRAQALTQESVQQQETVPSTPDLTQIEEFTTEDVERVGNVLNNQDLRTQRLEELRGNISNYWTSQQNLGINQDPARNTQEFIDFTKNLVEYAALTIADGTINTAQQFRDFITRGGELAIDEDITTNAFNQAQKAFVQQQVEAQTTTPRTTTKQTIAKSTEGRMQGNVTVTEKQALTNQIRTFNKGIREGIRQTREVNRDKAKQDKYETRFLKSEINTQIEDARKKGLFKGEVKGNVAQRLTKTVNNATTPTQLIKAIDTVERTLRDIDYTNKRSDATSNATRLKRRGRQKAEPRRGGLPTNVKTTLRELGSVTPISSELLQEYNTFAGNILANITEEKAVNINQAEVTELMDRVRKEVANQRRANIERYLELRDIDTDGMDTETLNASYDKLREELGDSRQEKGDIRETLDAVTEALRQELQEADLSDVNEMYSAEVEALKNVDVTRLSNNEVKFLNNAIYNLLNNGRVDGVGATITSKHKLFKALDGVDTAKIKSNVLSLNNFMKWLVRNIGSTSLTVKSAFSNIREVAPQVRSILGVTELFGKVKDVQALERKFESNILKIANKYKGVRRADSQIKISMVAELMQTNPNLTPEERLQEFEGRKKAIEESVQRTLARANPESTTYDSDFKRRHGNYAKGVESVYNKYFADVTTPEQALAKLGEGELTLYNYLLESFADLRDGMKYSTEVYGNSKWTDIENYIPRSYMYLGRAAQTDAPKYTESSFVAGQNIKATVTGSMNERVLNGDQLPADGFLNFDLFNGAVKEFRNQLYDVHTLPTRHYMNEVITNPEFKEIIGDEAIVNIFDQAIQRSVDSQKMYRGNDQSRSLGAAVWRFYNGLGNKIALGGIFSFAKQFAPTYMVTQANMPKNHMDIPLRVMHMSLAQRQDFLKFIKMFPVSERHKNSSGLFFQQTNNLKFDKLSKDIRSSLRDRAVRGVNSLDEVTNISLEPLTLGDQNSANIAWLSYYISDQLSRGKIKKFSDFNLQENATTPDQQSVAFAEQMTATTLNTNLSSDGSKFMQTGNKNLANTLIPFASFQINEFANMATDINVLSSKNVSTADKQDAGQRVIARMAGMVAINYVGWAIRDLFTKAGYDTIIQLATADGDDEGDEELIALLNSQRDSAVQSNLDNSLGYALTDAVFGQMSGDIGSNAFRSIETLVNSATGVEQSNLTWQDPFGSLGKLGIPAKALNNLITSGREWMTTDEEWRKNKFSIPTAYGEIDVPPEYQDEKRPFYSRATMAFSTFAAVPQLFGLSTQEVGSLSRAMKKAAKQAEQAQFGRDSKLTQEKLNESLRTFSREGVQYNLTDEQLDELKEIRLNYLNRPMNFNPQTGEYDNVYTTLKKKYQAEVKPDGKKYTLREIEAKINALIGRYAIDDLMVIHKGELRTKEQAENGEE